MMRPSTTVVPLLVAGWLIAGTAQTPTGPRFDEVAEATGLHFVHDNGARGDFWLPEIMGAGAALFDYDNDGDLDVFLVQGAPGAPGAASRPAGGTASATAAASTEPRTSRLFRNDLDRPAGTLRFSDVTRAAGVGLVAQGMGTAVGDIEGDGDLDLYVTALGDNTLYRNDGNGRFSDVTAAAGAGDSRWSSSAAFLDYDRDGDLDLFVANYVDFTPAGNKPCKEPAGERDYCAPLAYRPVPDRLLRNRGDGTFEDVSETAGITRADGNGLGVAVGDYDGDGWPDIYVANDATPNQLWMNRRDGTFEDMGPLSGTAYNAAGRPEGSMGVASGDYDRDGDEDLVVTNLVGETFVLYENDGAGGFEDRRSIVGLGAPTATMTGFGADWFDADNDGWLDLFLANGAVNIIPARRASPNRFAQRNQLFTTAPVAGRPAPPRRTVRLRDITDGAGPGMALEEVSRAAAFGDLDLDGRVDILVTNNGGPVRLLKNVTAGAGHWLRLALRQPQGNRFAVGARVLVDAADGEPAHVRRVRSDGSYLAASDLRVHVGLGQRETPVAVTVTWPDGVQQRFGPFAVDREHLVTRQP